MPPVSGRGSTRPDQIASVATRSAGRCRTASTLTPGSTAPPRLALSTNDLRGTNPAQAPRILRPSNLADRFLGRQDVGLTLLDHVADRRTLEALVLEGEPDDRGQDEEPDGDLQRPVVRRLDADDEDQVIDRIESTANSV